MTVLVNKEIFLVEIAVNMAVYNNVVPTRKCL